jgi:hypothetical protein
MNPLEKDELYQNLSGFLKNKGIELKDGSYAQGIQKSCNLLSEAINLGQQGLDRAKTGIDKKLDQMRQVIHEKTAPKSPPAAAQAKPAQPAAAAPKTRAKAKKRKPRA